MSGRPTAEIVAWLQSQVVVNSQLTAYEAVRLNEAADRLAELAGQADYWSSILRRAVDTARSFEVTP